MRSRNVYSRVGRVSMPDNESLCKTIFGITLADVQIVTCLIAAGVCGLPGASIAQITAMAGISPRGMNQLERSRWIVRVGKIAGSVAFVWAATPLAIQRLELTGWVALRFSDEELERLDLNAPGFLRAAENDEQRGRLWLKSLGVA